MSDTATLHTLRDGAIARVVVANPRRRNAFTVAMWRGLAETVTALGADAGVRVIAIEGEGEHFSSGADISEFGDARSTLDQALDYQALVDRANAAIAAVETPVVALVRGACYGGAVGVAAHCDLRIARSDAAFAIPAAKLGVSYDLAAIERLVDLVGPAETAAIFFTGDVLDAARARAIGLVNAVHEVETFEAATEATLAKIARMAPLTLRSVKRAIAIARDRKHTVEQRAAFDAAFRACFASADYAEGRLAHAEKRPPVFRGL